MAGRDTAGEVAGAEPSGPPRWRWVGACYSAADHRLVLSGSSMHGAVCLSFDRPVVCVPRRALIRLMSYPVS